MDDFIFHPSSCLSKKMGPDKSQFKVFPLASLADRLSLEENPPIGQTLIKYFKVGYYCGVVPFKVQFDVANRCWSVTRSKLHLGLALAFIWVPSLFWGGLNIIDLSIRFSKAPTRSAKSYFKIGYKYIDQVRWVTFLWVLFHHSKGIVASLNQASKAQLVSVSFGDDRDKERLKQKTSIQKATKYGNFYLTFMYLANGFILVALVIFGHDHGSSFESPARAFQDKILVARRRLFLGAAPWEADSQVGYSATDIFLGILYTWLLAASAVVYNTAELFHLVPYPITMWLMAKNFEGTMAARGTSDVGIIFQNYEETKRFSELLNATWSKLNLLWIVDVALRTIFIFDDAGDAGPVSDLAWVLLLICFLVYQSVTFALSADVFIKMDTFKQWLTSKQNWRNLHLSQSNSSELKRILAELNDNPVGISSKGIYKCTYGFLAQVFALVITVFVVSFEK